jgi:hypothetical protein
MNKRPSTTMPLEGSSKKRHRLAERTSDSDYEEYTEQEEQPPSEDEPLMDLMGAGSRKIRRLRDVPEDDWFRGNTGLLTATQKSLIRSWNLMKIKLFEHKTLDWTVLNRASGGANISAYFERFEGLSDLVSRHSRYVKEWVKVFYATLWIPGDRSFISFIFENHRCTITREELAGLLGVDLHPERCLHNLVYGDALPPRRALVASNFPAEEEVSTLFGDAFTVGSSYRTPNLLSPEAKVVHRALRRTLLPRIPNDETITSLQQWLLLCIMTGQAFDIVDFLLCEIEDVIFDGMLLSQQLPYAHFISFFLSHMRKRRYQAKYKMSSSSFTPYMPSSLRNGRRGQRDKIHGIDMHPTTDQCAGSSQANLQVNLSNPNQAIVLDVASGSDDDDIIVEPLPMGGPRQHEASGSGSKSAVHEPVTMDTDALLMKLVGQEMMVEGAQQKMARNKTLLEQWVMKFEQVYRKYQRSEKRMTELLKRIENQDHFNRTVVQAIPPAVAKNQCPSLLEEPPASVGGPEPQLVMLTGSEQPTGLVGKQYQEDTEVINAVCRDVLARPAEMKPVHQGSAATPAAKDPTSPNGTPSPARSSSDQNAQHDAVSQVESSCSSADNKAKQEPGSKMQSSHSSSGNEDTDTNSNSKVAAATTTSAAYDREVQ